jgi:hypothetical protein
MDKTTKTIVWVVVALVVIGLIYALAQNSDELEDSSEGARLSNQRIV